MADRFEAGGKVETVEVENIPEGWYIMDIGPDTTALFSDKINAAQTVVWNGPLGVYEMKPFARGTDSILKTVAEAKAVSVVGGGDLGAAVAKAGIEEKLTHVSTGGGAFLDFLAGKELPGIKALQDKV